MSRNSYRHQLNHTPKQIYHCDFPECQRQFVRQDLCNRHRERHTAKGSQLQRKDSMLNNVSPATEGMKPIPMHGSASPETTRPTMTGRPRGTQVQYPSPPENASSPFSPATVQSSTTFTGSASSSTVNDFTYQQPTLFIKRSNSDHSLPAGQVTRPSLSRSQRNSFGVADSKSADPPFSRAPLQPALGPFGFSSSTTSNQHFQGQSSMHSPYVSQQNFPPFAPLPPPGYASTTATTSPREVEPSYPISSPRTAIPSEYQQRDPGPGQQSGPEVMLLDQMTLSNTMPVFGGEGYSRSPFAIPDDFVAYLFSEQQSYNSSPMGHSGVGQQAYAK